MNIQPGNQALNELTARGETKYVATYDELPYIHNPRVDDTAVVKRLEARDIDDTVPVKAVDPDPDDYKRSSRGKYNAKGDIKRKKSKKRSHHLPNMNNGKVKAALGVSILSRLGKIQRDTQDAYKKALLKEVPMADLVELSTGVTLPDYQANLINKFHSQVDPDAPVVQRFVNKDEPKIEMKNFCPEVYELDDGPLTDAQIEAIRNASPATNLPDSAFDQRLFPTDDTFVSKTDPSLLGKGTIS